MRISVLIPAFNEEGNIRKTIDSYYEVLAGQVEEFEVIVVNDGSVDGTAAMLNELAVLHPRLKVFHHPRNRGMGAAVRTAFGHARYEWIFITCADLQFDAREITNFFPFTDKADIITGYKTDTHDNVYRKINTWVNGLLLCVLFGLTLRNPNWVKLMRRKVCDTLPISPRAKRLAGNRSPLGLPIEFDGFFWDSALLIKARDRGSRFAEAPTTCYPRIWGRATGSHPIRVFKTFLALLRFWVRYKTGI